MVLIKEYRIPLPMTVEEYKIAQLYMVAKVSKNHSSNGEGVEILENKPYTDGASSGQYTHKIFHILNKLPSWVRAICPSSLQIDEKAWNAYPYCKTTYSCPLLGEKFSISIETRYAQDAGTQDNCLGLTGDDLKLREVDFVDIAYDPIDPSKYKKEEDPTLFKSEKTGRGLLPKDWFKSTSPVMCSYKVCKVEFRYWGLQTKVENFIQRAAIRDILFMGHRQVFCWMDEWFGMNLEDIRKMEDEVKHELSQNIANKQQQQSAPSTTTVNLETNGM
ncbi:phosphatidylinositol transfer protein [Tieghemostelium lacteum]|uniref:Phosphatidylinositol transfer protein n=1 Tax=Tieghemostelium lacteum TaxID=361077 RepID=A0A151ZGN7_TIELA|nr:phosphatidylinositol transfer protein [Tieghemostelium lacteum]|eukprot:KYQ93148.1 phosphatidylinositol transfer protein [Tieghemostelium lacteum]